jgi:hypothetical protein
MKKIKNSLISGVSSIFLFGLFCVIDSHGKTLVKLYAPNTCITYDANGNYHITAACSTVSTDGPCDQIKSCENV